MIRQEPSIAGGDGSKFPRTGKRPEGDPPAEENRPGAPDNRLDQSLPGSRPLYVASGRQVSGNHFGDSANACCTIVSGVTWSGFRY
jgi:hypothetical protein